MLERIHHINLLVGDLEAAVQQYTQLLGVNDWVYGELAERRVRTARFRAGESWVVLVQPTDPEGAPGRYLAEHGEGLFLLSFGVADLDEALAGLDVTDSRLRRGPERAGLEGWRVADLSPDIFFGARLQLTQDDADQW
jgi:methylmalonyl-CoA/ethylmalonyl-CoA epimerase